MSDAEHAVFRLDGVCKHFGGRPAVDDISLAIARGTTTALIGSSGSGKSTLLRLMTGLLWPDRGAVEFEGQVLRRDVILAMRRRIGYVIQEGGLFPHLTVLGNLALLPRHLGWPTPRIRERAAELAELTRLHGDLLQRFPAELSGGQRQRVALMRALMADPPALLLDEPLGALDPLVRYELQDELKRIVAALGKTVVLVTHDIAEAAFLASRLVLLRNGRVLQDGSVADFRERPADPFVTRFMHSGRGMPEVSP